MSLLDGRSERRKPSVTHLARRGLLAAIVVLMAFGVSLAMVAPRGASVSHSTSLARTVKAGSAIDTLTPTTPRRLRVGNAGATSLGLVWDRSRDKVGVAGYRISVDGVLVRTPRKTAYTVVGLTCGRGYQIAVAAYDAAGNRSIPAKVMAATKGCSDTSAPSAPGPLVQFATTESGFATSWSASSDNIGVVSYVLFRGGIRVGSTAQQRFSLTALTCGTGYAIGVEALDGAGNRSKRTSTFMATASCPGMTGPSVPSGVKHVAAEASVSLSWSPSEDDVGVAGYRVLRGGTLAGDTARPATQSQICLAAPRTHWMCSLSTQLETSPVRRRSSPPRARALRRPT